MPEEYIRVEEEAQRETDAPVEAAHFDAFQGIVLEHAPTKGGRVKEMKILTLPRFLENSQGIFRRSFDSDAVYLTVNFDPDSSALPRKRDFPLGCPVQGRTQGEVKQFLLLDYTLRCIPGSFALVRNEGEELALLDGLHEDFDDQVRQELKTQPNSEQAGKEAVDVACDKDMEFTHGMTTARCGQHESGSS